MAREKTPEEQTTDNERKQLAEEKKKLKKEQQAQRKEAKRRAKEIAKQEDALDDGSEGNSLLTFGATILIVVLWMAVICAIIKLDIGGFGSSVVTPILKDVPVLNKILPANSITETTDGSAYGGYTSLEDAVDQIKSLELQLEQAQTASAAKEEELDQLKAEVLRHISAYPEHLLQFHPEIRPSYPIHNNFHLWEPKNQSPYMYYLTLQK